MALLRLGPFGARGAGVRLRDDFEALRIDDTPALRAETVLTGFDSFNGKIDPEDVVRGVRQRLLASVLQNLQLRRATALKPLSLSVDEIRAEHLALLRNK